MEKYNYGEMDQNILYIYIYICNHNTYVANSCPEGIDNLTAKLTYCIVSK